MPSHPDLHLSMPLRSQKMVGALWSRPHPAATAQNSHGDHTARRRAARTGRGLMANKGSNE